MEEMTEKETLQKWESAFGKQIAGGVFLGEQEENIGCFAA